MAGVVIAAAVGAAGCAPSGTTTPTPSLSGTAGEFQAALQASSDAAATAGGATWTVETDGQYATWDTNSGVYAVWREDNGPAGDRLVYLEQSGVGVWQDLVAAVGDEAASQVRADVNPAAKWVFIEDEETNPDPFLGIVRAVTEAVTAGSPVTSSDDTTSSVIDAATGTGRVFTVTLQGSTGVFRVGADGLLVGMNVDGQQVRVTYGAVEAVVLPQRSQTVSWAQVDAVVRGTPPSGGVSPAPSSGAPVPEPAPAPS